MAANHSDGVPAGPAPRREWVGPYTAFATLGLGLCVAGGTLVWLEATGSVDWMALGKGLGVFVALAVAIYWLGVVREHHRHRSERLDRSLSEAGDAAERARDAESKLDRRQGSSD